MVDLRDLPNSQTDDYNVFFDNIMGCCSMVTVMRKDKSDVVPHHSCVFVAFIDVPVPGDDPLFAWHDNVKELPSLPFTEEWAIKQYNLHREKAFNVT